MRAHPDGVGMGVSSATAFPAPRPAMSSQFCQPSPGGVICSGLALPSHRSRA